MLVSAPSTSRGWRGWHFGQTHAARDSFGAHLGKRPGPRAAIEYCVEQQLERGVRLPTKRNFGTEQQNPSAADRRVDDGRPTVEELLPPRPAAVEDVGAGKPCDRRRLLDPRIRRELEYRAIVEDDVDAAGHAERQWVGRIDLHAHERARNVELLVRERT